MEEYKDAYTEAIKRFRCSREELTYIKANLPESPAAYEQGTGEGCFFLVPPEAKKAYDTNEEGTIYEGVLDNVSVYFPGILPGDLLPLEMRGDFRPVVPYDYLKELQTIREQKEDWQ